MTEKDFMGRVNKASRAIIYGAGMVGELVWRQLSAARIENKIEAFAVTNASLEKSFHDIPVREIGTLKECIKDALVIIATIPATHKEIRKTLGENGFEKIVEVDSELYKELADSYVNDFVKKKQIKHNKIDVMYMASDNNATSGAFLCMVDINREMIKRGRKTLVVLPEYGNGEQLLIDYGIEYTYVLSEHWAVKEEGFDRDGKDMRLEKNQSAIKELEKIIEQHHVKVVHNNTTYTYVGAVAASNKGIPYVWHLRENIVAQGCMFYDEKAAYQWINGAEKICVVSNYIRQCYSGLCPDKIQIIYDGVDCFQYFSEREILRDLKQITLIMVGVITPLKGQEELLKAINLIKQEGKRYSFKVLFVGNGDKSYIDSLKCFVNKQRMMDEVCFVGRQRNVKKYYEMADVAIVCSRAEAFGRTTVEAQLAGCCVVGADVGATIELISEGKTGFLYSCGNAEQLARKIEEIIEKYPLARNVARYGQREALEKYSKEKNISDMIKVYEEIRKNLMR